MDKKLITVTAGIIHYNGKILVAQRRHDKSLGNLWEFPGGKIEPGETCEQTLAREIREEFSIDIKVGEYLFEHTYEYPDFTLKMYVYAADWDGNGKIEICDHEQYRFVHTDEMDSLEFAAADYPVINFLKQHPAVAA